MNKKNKSPPKKKKAKGIDKIKSRYSHALKYGCIGISVDDIIVSKEIKSWINQKIKDGSIKKTQIKDRSFVRPVIYLKED